MKRRIFIAILILIVLVGFAWAMVPTKDTPEPIRRGLDLKGGTHLVMRVNVGDAVRLETDQGAEMLKAQAKKANLPIPTTRQRTSRPLTRRTRSSPTRIPVID